MQHRLCSICYACCELWDSFLYSDPLTEIGRLDVGSIVNASNVSRTNMVALIGGGERPKFSQNTLVVYDAAASEPVMDITFGSPLRKVVTEQTNHYE